MPLHPTIAAVTDRIRARSEGPRRKYLDTMARAAAEGRLAIVRTMYMLTHLAIFFLAYIGTSDITPGWLMINI